MCSDICRKIIVTGFSTNRFIPRDSGWGKTSLLYLTVEVILFDRLTRSLISSAVIFRWTWMSKTRLWIHGDECPICSSTKRCCRTNIGTRQAHAWSAWMFSEAHAIQKNIIVIAYSVRTPSTSCKKASRAFEYPRRWCEESWEDVLRCVSTSTGIECIVLEIGVFDALFLPAPDSCKSFRFIATLNGTKRRFQLLSTNLGHTVVKKIWQSMKPWTVKNSFTGMSPTSWIKNLHWRSIQPFWQFAPIVILREAIISESDIG